MIIWVYLSVATGRNIRKKTACHMHPHTVYVYMDTLENSRQNDCKRIDGQSMKPKLREN